MMMSIAMVRTEFSTPARMPPRSTSPGDIIGLVTFAQMKTKPMITTKMRIPTTVYVAS